MEKSENIDTIQTIETKLPPFIARSSEKYPAKKTLPSLRKSFTRQDQDIEYDDRINFFGGMIARSEVEIHSAIHAQIEGGVRIDALL